MKMELADSLLNVKLAILAASHELERIEDILKVPEEGIKFTINQKEQGILLKCAENRVIIISTHSGCITPPFMCESEKALLHDLALNLNKDNAVIVLNDRVFTAHKCSYNGEFIVIGIKINYIIKNETKNGNYE